jgi:CRP-like cAMP-binding protein
MDIALLRKIPLFSRLDDAELSRLGPLLRDRVIGANEPVIWVGESGSEVFLIQSGKVTVTAPDEQGKEVVLSMLGPGDFFGDLALLDDGPRSASVRTLEPCNMLVLERDDFLKFLRQNPDVAIDVLATVGKRYRETLEKLRGVTNANAVIESSATGWERVADAIASISASQAFVLLHVFWFGVWIILNMILSQSRGFDPFPFGLLTLIVSLEAIFLSIFVLISARST